MVHYLRHTLIGHLTKLRLWAGNCRKGRISSIPRGGAKVNLTGRHLFALAAISILMLSTGCSERDPTELQVARARIDPMVFDEQYDPFNVLYGEDAYFQPFSGTDANSLKVDSLYASNGSLSIKVSVPPKGSALGVYAGGVLTAVESRDFTDFNALTFKARTESLTDIVLDVVGFGNDNTGTSLYEAGRANIPIGPEWTFVIIPVPAPSKLISERGIFTFAEGFQEPHTLGYDIWFDEIQFAQLNNVTDPRPIMPSGNKQAFIGASVSLQGTRTAFNVDGAFVFVDHSANYFDFFSSDESVAVVSGSEVKLVGEGTATITGKLEDVDANGRIVLTGYLPPESAATPPTHPAGEVISMFSDVYNDVNVDTWNTEWGGSTAQVQNFVVDGDNTMMYTGLNFVGIEFLNPMIDASAMTHFNMDVYAPAGTNFKVKLVSFPPGLPNSVETADLILDNASTPAFIMGDWSYLDIPMADFQLPEGWSWAHVGQLVLSTSNAQLVLVDNVYWHK